MSCTPEMPTTKVHPSEEIVNTARTLASKQGISVEEYILLAVTDRVSAADATEAFFRERMANASRGAWREALAAISHRPTDPVDEIEES